MYLEVYMFKAVLRMLVIAVMLVAFVGQALAFNASISCETSVDFLSPNFSELVKHYDSNPIDTDSPEDCCGIECCDLDCICIAHAYSSFMFINTALASIKTATLSKAIYMQLSKLPNSIITLLYRPPIVTS